MGVYNPTLSPRTYPHRGFYDQNIFQTPNAMLRLLLIASLFFASIEKLDTVMLYIFWHSPEAKLKKFMSYPFKGIYQSHIPNYIAKISEPIFIIILREDI